MTAVTCCHEQPVAPSPNETEVSITNTISACRQCRGDVVAVVEVVGVDVNEVEVVGDVVVGEDVADVVAVVVVAARAWPESIRSIKRPSATTVGCTMTKTCPPRHG